MGLICLGKSGSGRFHRQTSEDFSRRPQPRQTKIDSKFFQKAKHIIINQLEYYAEVVKQRNFKKEAEKLFVSQSSLSKSILVLEKEFQAELIDRTSKDFALTREGVMFHEYALKLLGCFHARRRGYIKGSTTWVDR